MRIPSASGLSYHEKLQIIENFSVRFAQSIIGGTKTPPNDPYGDLCHEDGTYSEVKGSGNSSGAIIRRKQLNRHCTGPTQNYVIVFRENRFLKDGQWCYPTLQKARTPKTLEKYLLETVREVYVVDKMAVKKLYLKLRRRPGREKEHQFRTGPKIYIKMRPSDFIGAVLFGYAHSSELRMVQFESQTVRFGLNRIVAK